MKLTGKKNLDIPPQNQSLRTNPFQEFLPFCSEKRLESEDESKDNKLDIHQSSSNSQASYSLTDLAISDPTLTGKVQVRLGGLLFSQSTTLGWAGRDFPPADDRKECW